MNRAEKSTTGQLILLIAGTIIAFTAMAAIFVVYMSISVVLILFSIPMAVARFLKDLAPLF